MRQTWMIPVTTTRRDVVCYFSFWYTCHLSLVFTLPFPKSDVVWVQGMCTCNLLHCDLNRQSFYADVVEQLADVSHHHLLFCCLCYGHHYYHHHNKNNNNQNNNNRKNNNAVVREKTKSNLWYVEDIFVNDRENVLVWTYVCIHELTDDVGCRFCDVANVSSTLGRDELVLLQWHDGAECT